MQHRKPKIAGLKEVLQWSAYTSESRWNRPSCKRVFKV